MSKIAYFICVVFVVVGIGCASLSQLVTPATIEVKAVDYAVEAGVVDANDFKGYHNLEKAIRLELAVKNAYEVNSLALQQMMEKNQLTYTMLNSIVVRNTEIAREREEMLFSEKGLLSMGLGLIGVGGFTGLLGLMRKRPGDLTAQDFENAVVEVKGEVTNKERQLIELVTKIKKYMDTYKTEAEALKEIISHKQSPELRETVAKIKATI